MLQRPSRRRWNEFKWNLRLGRGKLHFAACPRGWVREEVHWYVEPDQIGACARTWSGKWRDGDAIAVHCIRPGFLQTCHLVIESLVGACNRVKARQEAQEASKRITEVFNVGSSPVVPRALPSGCRLHWVDRRTVELPARARRVVARPRASTPATPHGARPLINCPPPPRGFLHPPVPHASPASSARCSASVCSRLASPSLTFMPSTLSSGLTMRTIETQSGDRWQM